MPVIPILANPILAEQLAQDHFDSITAAQL